MRGHLLGNPLFTNSRCKMGCALVRGAGRATVKPDSFDTIPILPARGSSYSAVHGRWRGFSESGITLAVDFPSPSATVASPLSSVIALGDRVLVWFRHPGVRVCPRSFRRARHVALPLPRACLQTVRQLQRGDDGITVTHVGVHLDGPYGGDTDFAK